MPTVIQISDCHLLADPEGEVRGLRTRESFLKVWRHVCEHYPDADRLVISGDLTHDERIESYRALQEIIGDRRSRTLVIPGNHDDRALQREVFGVPEVPGLDRVVFVDDLPGWRLIGLDSHVPGKLHGSLGHDQLQWLDRVLQEAASKPTVLFMHHPPVPVESRWLDEIGLQDAGELAKVMGRHRQVKAIQCGHVHQFSYHELEKIPVLTAPSTGLQFKPHTDNLEIDDVQPGYCVLTLGENGRCDSRVERTHLLDGILLLEGPEFGIEFYNYLIAKLARADEMTALEEEAYLLITMSVDVEMTGLIALFHQTFSLRDCEIVAVGLQKVGLERLAEQFLQAKLIYVQGRTDLTQEEFQSINFWEDLSEAEQQRFEEIGNAISTGASGLYSIQECVEKSVKSALRQPRVK